MTIFELNIFGFTLAPTYYWLMYAISFLIWYFIFSKRKIYIKDEIDSLFIYIFLWVVLGWRIWYILFYNLPYYLENPISMLNVTEWWMSFHGWVIGVILAMIFFAKNKKTSFLKLADELTTVLPIWLFFWRIWNYINKELLWFENYYWIFAVKIWEKSFFPSPLLEAFLEWLILFLILNFAYKSKKFKTWQIATLFLIFYAIFRIFVEIFFRQPDVQIWYIGWFITMWTILTLPMLILWIIIFFILRKNEN